MGITIKNILKHIWLYVCAQYLVVFFILTVGLKLYILNTYLLTVTWPSNQYWMGITVGFASTALIFSPLFFIRKHKNKVAIILASLLTIILFVDTVYCSYFKTLPTFGLLSSLGGLSDQGPAIANLLKWKYALFFADIVFVLLVYKPVSTFFSKQTAKFAPTKSGRSAAGLSLAAIVVWFWMSLQPMGGVTKLEDVVARGYDTVSTAQYYGILMAHALDATRYIQEETTHLSDAQSQDLVNWVKTNKPAQATSDLTGVAKGKNIIMIQVESLGAFAINQTINGQEITPNLNKLAKSSQFFPNDRFVIAAGHTSDTDFVSNSSYFPLTDSAVFVRYGQDDFNSLPKTLIQSGYSAYAYHGFNRNFWNRNVALSSLGYQKFYAADNYPDGAIINMGLNDGDFLSKTADYIKSQPKPSFSYAITLSSHVPFSVTDQTKALGLNLSDYPDQVGGYLETINYTDRMLGAFFDKLKAAGLYDDSLIVLFGDHTPVLPSFTAGTITYDHTSVQEEEVPLFVKLPNETDGKTYANQGTHLDIMPTILDLAGIKTNQLMFGQSLFANSKDALSVCTNQLVAFKSSGDCTATLAEEQSQSAMIIRYNQFSKLPKTTVSSK